MKYQKPWLSFDQQVALLQSRGLLIGNHSEALQFLSNVSYYRLSAYFLPFQIAKDRFASNASFTHIVDTYSFDQSLRLMAFEAIDHIEIALRTKIIYHISRKYGPKFLEDSTVFTPAFQDKRGLKRDYYLKLQSIISSSLNKRHPEPFIIAFKHKYQDETIPPAWIMIELLTLGELSEMYSNLKHEIDKRAIADDFVLPVKVFNSWLHTLTYIRNLCGHHCRLWNRDLSIDPEKMSTNPSKRRNPWLQQDIQIDNRRTFYSLCVIKYLLNVIQPQNSLGTQLSNLIKAYPRVPVQYMGIPSNRETGKMIDWQTLPVWRD